MNFDTHLYVTMLNYSAVRGQQVNITICYSLLKTQIHSYVDGSTLQSSSIFSRNPIINSKLASKVDNIPSLNDYFNTLTFTFKNRITLCTLSSKVTKIKSQEYS